MTFDPHPAEVVRPGSHPAVLTTLRRRAELVAELGVDAFLVLPFTVALSQVTAEEFVHDVIVDRLHVASVVVGENFRFGHRGRGVGRHCCASWGRGSGSPPWRSGWSPTGRRRHRSRHRHLDLRAQLRRRRRRPGRGRGARPAAPGGGFRRARRRPRRQSARLSHREPRSRGARRGPRGRHLRGLVPTRHPAFAGGDLHRHEPDVLRPGPHGRGVRHRRGRQLLRPPGRASTSSSGCGTPSGSTPCRS